ncbi:MAG: 1-deoxy-D-xylulose-5-phosphate reductoisomerase, partial [candidate division WOR-3 bacterium]|nr:1-deoxy-D-xylulose-5-phosphate reductoisomerase [candidate division WOR-3 bacterium]
TQSPIPKILWGQKGLSEVATDPQVDYFVMAMSGTEGIIPLLAAIEKRKRILLATKELMVSFGKIIMERIKKYNTTLLPIDSELVGINQCLEGHRLSEVKKIIITASGGPFLWRSDFRNITIKETLKHPTWKMGKKTTVDSATLANKGLEVMEVARYFEVSWEKIEVVIHPQSIIHAMIEFNDNSVIAQMSRPDMKLCIQYALTYPRRLPSLAKALDLTNYRTLEFYRPNFRRFLALRLAYEALKLDGIAPCVYNAANEVAVKSFLEGKISFLAISQIIKKTLFWAPQIKNPKLEDLLQWEKEAKNFAERLICSHQ